MAVNWYVTYREKKMTEPLKNKFTSTNTLIKKLRCWKIQLKAGICQSFCCREVYDNCLKNLVVRYLEK